MIPSLDGPVATGWTEAPAVAESPHVPHRREGPGRFEQLVGRLATDIDRGEALTAGAAHARYQAMDAGTLIALQAGIYRFSEAIDLTVKLVDRTATAAKTVLESGR